MFWNDDNQVLLVTYAEFLIEVCIQDDQSNCSWRLFAVYASTEKENKKEGAVEYVESTHGGNRDRCLLIV